MDVNIRLTIEPAAFLTYHSPSSSWTATKLQVARAKRFQRILSPSLGAWGEKRETIASRYHRANHSSPCRPEIASNCLANFHSSSWISAAPFPLLASLSLSLCLSIKSLAIKLNRISLYHPSFVPTNTTYKSRRLFVMSNATGNLLGSNRVATIDISRYISTERTYIVRGVDSSTRNDTWFLGGHASIPTRYFPFLSFETRSLRSLKRLLSFVKQFVSSVHREDTDCGEKKDPPRSSEKS